MDFDQYHDTVLEHAIAFGDASNVARAIRKPGKRPSRKKPSQTLLERPEAKQLTAAAALVIAERGEEWCLAHPTEFRSALIKHLGTIAQIVLTVAGFVTGTGGVWMILAKILIPAILSYLSTRSRPKFGAAAASPDDWRSVTGTAQQILRGET
jgi:hypothetical protein